MSAETVRFRDFELDPNVGELRRNGQIVHLERIPLALLSLLVQRSGQIVTRDEILERVWGKGVYIDIESGINTAVRKIRRALDDDADTPQFVATIPAKGYRFMAPVVIPNGELITNGGLVQARPPAGELIDGRPEGIYRRGRIGAFSAAVLAVVVTVALLAWHFAFWPLNRAAAIPSGQIPHILLKTPDAHVPLPPREQPALPLPDIPSIAVLPFANLSGDPRQDYFSDGITDDLVTDLGRLPGLFVIDRNSTFSYKGKAPKTREAGRELGVRYILEGSARQEGGRVRINVQLVEALTGDQVWVHRYDKQLRDVFALQDEIVQSLVAILHLQLAMLQQGYAIPQYTKNLEAYDDFLRGFEYLTNVLNLNQEGGFAKVRQMFEKAIRLDPGYADAYAFLGLSYYVGYMWLLDRGPGVLDHADELAQRSIELDDSESAAYAIRGWIAAVKGQHDRALTDGERAVALDSNSALACVALADVNEMDSSGNPGEALAYARKAKRLDPLHHATGALEEGLAYTMLRRYAEAINALRKGEQNNPWVHLSLIYAYSELGQVREARVEAEQVLRVSPGFSLLRMQRTLSKNWQDPVDQHYLADMRAAGLK